MDRNLTEEPLAKISGSTASVAILHSLDAPSSPFFSSQKLALTVAHVGYVFSAGSLECDTELKAGYSDTRVLLCSTDRGRVLPMTEVHRAEGRVESTRLRRMMGTGLITDSFGDARHAPLSLDDLFLIRIFIVDGWVYSRIPEGKDNSLIILCNSSSRKPR